MLHCHRTASVLYLKPGRVDAAVVGHESDGVVAQAR